MEPERPIEKLLRSYAKQRREKAGAAPELHPAARRLLQSEVARRTAARSTPGFLLRLLAWRRARLAYALCVVAVLFAAILVSPVLNRTGTETRFASPEAESSALVSRRQESPGLAPASVPPSAGAPAAVPARSLSPMPAQPALKSPTELEPAFASAVTGRATSSPAAANAPSSAVLETMAVAKTVAQVFKSEQSLPTGSVSGRLDRAKGASAPHDANSGVLTSFRLEQTGNEIRILDSDGSVYTGQGRYVAAAGARQTVAAHVAGSQVQTNVSANQELDKLGTRIPQPVYSFRVTGTNRTLNQLVIFTGRLAPITNAEWSDRTTTTNSTITGEATVRPPSLGQAELPLADSRISGTALLNNHREIRIDAIPAKP